jgi:hypothetical protein
MALQSGDVLLAHNMPGRVALRKELDGVAWRKSDHPDDLVIAASLAVWRATNPRW